MQRFVLFYESTKNNGIWNMDGDYGMHIRSSLHLSLPLSRSLVSSRLVSTSRLFPFFFCLRFALLSLFCASHLVPFLTPPTFSSLLPFFAPFPPFSLPPNRAFCAPSFPTCPLFTPAPHPLHRAPRRTPHAAHRPHSRRSIVRSSHSGVGFPGFLPLFPCAFAFALRLAFFRVSGTGPLFAFRLWDSRFGLRVFFWFFFFRSTRPFFRVAMRFWLRCRSLPPSLSRHVKRRPTNRAQSMLSGFGVGRAASPAPSPTPSPAAASIRAPSPSIPPPGSAGSSYPYFNFGGTPHSTGAFAGAIPLSPGGGRGGSGSGSGSILLPDHGLDSSSHERQLSLTADSEASFPPTEMRARPEPGRRRSVRRSFNGSSGVGGAGM